MQQYPYYSPQILTDSVFLKYGGQTGTSTQGQRDAAYLLAEEQMTEHLSTFLVPTVITGTAWYKGGTLFETEFGHVLNISKVYARIVQSLDPLDARVYTGSALVRNSEYGYVDIILPQTYWTNCGIAGFVYDISAVYESGFSSGTVTSPTMLSALAMAAQINLNEWDVSLSNEGVADVGVQSFSNQSYSEQRRPLLNTAFGNSAMANRVAKLTRKYRSKPVTGFR